MKDIFMERVVNDLELADLDCSITLDRIELYTESYLQMDKFVYESEDGSDSSSGNSEETKKKLGEKIKEMVQKAIDSIKEFFNKCRSTLKEVTDKLRNRAKKAYTTYELREAMSDFQDIVIKASAKGKKTVKYFDIEATYSCFVKEANELQQYIKNTVSKYINSVQNNRITEEDLDKISKDLDSIHDKYDNEIKEIIDKKKEYPIAKAKMLYAAIEAENFAKNNSYVTKLDEFDAIYDSAEKDIVKFLEELQKTADDDPDTYKKIQSVNKIKSVVSKASSFVHQHSGLCITALISSTVVVNQIIHEVSINKQVKTITSAADSRAN